MTQAVVSYGNPSQPQTNTATVPTTLTVTETDLVIMTNMKDLQKSQFSVYAGVTLGGVASVTFAYYHSPDNGTTWYPLCFAPNPATSAILQRKGIMDSTSYSTAGVSRFIDSVAVDASTAFKVTGVAASGTPTLNYINVLVRDN